MILKKLTKYAAIWTNLLPISVDSIPNKGPFLIVSPPQRVKAYFFSSFLHCILFIIWILVILLNYLLILVVQRCLLPLLFSVMKYSSLPTTNRQKDHVKQINYNLMRVVISILNIYSARQRRELARVGN